MLVRQSKSSAPERTDGAEEKVVDGGEHPKKGRGFSRWTLEPGV